MSLDTEILDEDKNPNLLLVDAAARLMFYVDDIASILENELFDVLLPLPAGQYHAGAIDPVSPKDAKKYKAAPPESFSNHYLDTKIVTTRQTNTLLNEPSVPARGIKLFKAIVETEINNINPFTRQTNVEDTIAKHLIAGTDCEDVMALCHDDIVTLHQFIGDDVWYMYSVKYVNNCLLIEKTVDFRIYDWHCRRFDLLQKDE